MSRTTQRRGARPNAAALWEGRKESVRRFGRVAYPSANTEFK